MENVNGIWLPDNEKSFIYHAVKASGTFETDRLAEMLEHTTNGRRAVDGGAHCGIWTLLLAKCFEHVEAFECASETIAALEKNTEALDNVTVHKEALGVARGYGKLGENDEPENTGKSYVVSGGDFPIIPLDSYDFHDVDLLKLDIEGMELMGLIGSKETIEKSHPVILVEMNGLAERYGGTYFEAGEYLESLGYTLVRRINKDYIYSWTTPV